MFKLDLVVSRACGDQDVSSRDRDTGGTRASCEIKGGTSSPPSAGEPPLKSLQQFSNLLFSTA
jgi:hypothetical protein